MAHAYINLDAFNLTPGATFTDGYQGDENGSVWIAVHVARNIDKEDVYVWARRGDEISEGPGDSVENRSFVFDFCDPVAVIGFVVNATDPDDNNWGANTSAD